MHIADLVNGSFELGGGAMLIRNCFALYRDKVVRGVSIPVSGFFAAWGIWNLAYYPMLHQWASFAGGTVIVSANIVWTAMAFYYSTREK